MECDKIRSRLSWYLDGEISEEESLQVAAHLDLCGGCAEKLHALRMLSQALGRFDAEAPADLGQRIAAALAREREVESLSCNSLRPLLMAFVDGDADALQARTVQEHLASCARCAQEMALLQSTVRVLASVPEVAPPADLRARILAATVNRPTWQERIRARLREVFSPVTTRLAVGGAAATVVLLAALASHLALSPQASLPVVISPTPVSQPPVTRGARPTDVAARSEPEAKPLLSESDAEWQETISLPNRRPARTLKARAHALQHDEKPESQTARKLGNKPKPSAKKDGMVVEPLIEPPLFARTEYVTPPTPLPPAPEVKVTPPLPPPKATGTVRIATNINTLDEGPLADLRASLKQKRPEWTDVDLSVASDRKITVPLVKTSF